MHGILYFFHNYDKPSKNPSLEQMKKERISSVLYLPTNVVIEEIRNNWFNLKKNFKINDKKGNNLNDIHESAFICVNVDYLSHKYNDVKVFHKKEEMESNFYLKENHYPKSINNKVKRDLCRP